MRASGRTARINRVRVGVVDVGSNTVRLLVAADRRGCVEPVHEERTYLRLGQEVEQHGWIGDAKLRETVECVRRYAKIAREHGAHELEAVITAPGRRAANGDELVSAIARGAGAPVRVLTAEEEALLAFTGALACRGDLPETVAVCDSGGGSTEVVVGTKQGATWVRSVDVGSLTVRALLPDDPPGKSAVEAARAAVRERLGGMTPPVPKGAYATGGTARALRRIVGRELGSKELDVALRRMAKRSAAEIAQQYGIDRERAWTLVGGAVVLAELQSRLNVSLRVARGGMREGIAAAAFAELAAA
jgi:exopolyphosphatase / guanosine-5'-triphosphate,3'-diphosphate pyrophosphatase